MVERVDSPGIYLVSPRQSLILTPRQAETAIRGNILIIKDRIEQPTRFGLAPIERGLYTVTCNEDLGDVHTEYGVGKIEKWRLQQIGPKVISEFGVDLKNFLVKYPCPPRSNKNAALRHKKFIYLSSEIPGMFIVEQTQECSDSEFPVVDSWAVVDNGPPFALHLRRLFLQARQPFAKRSRLAAV